jgi:hypothetical protein
MNQKPLLTYYSTSTWLLGVALVSLTSACSSESKDDDALEGSGGQSGDGDAVGGGTGVGDSGGSNGDGDPRGACPVETRVGYFVSYLGQGATIFDGSVAEVVAPSAIPEVLAEEGECRLLQDRSLFCSETCAFGTVCAGDDQCVPERENVDAGTVSVTGLEVEFSSEPNGITLKYGGNISEPFPGFVPGAEVKLMAAGGVVEGFSLAARGVSQIETDIQNLPVESGSPVELTWNIGDVAAEKSEIYVNFSINTHGSTSGRIECIGADDGSLEIAESLITELMTLGLSGFPRMSLTRRSIDSVEIAPGCVNFSVQTEVGIDLVVDGVISCDDDLDCPDGQSCKDGELWCVPE